MRALRLWLPRAAPHQMPTCGVCFLLSRTFGRSCAAHTWSISLAVCVLRTIQRSNRPRHARTAVLLRAASAPLSAEVEAQLTTAMAKIMMFSLAVVPRHDKPNSALTPDQTTHHARLPCMHRQCWSLRTTSPGTRQKALPTSHQHTPNLHSTALATHLAATQLLHRPTRRAYDPRAVAPAFGVVAQPVPSR